MTLQKITQEINARISYLETKKEKLIIREMSIQKMKQLKKAYENELDALYAARRGIKSYYN